MIASVLSGATLKNARKYCGVICLVSCAFLSAMALPVFSDQNDPQLNALFDDLKRAGNPLEARELEGQIWQIWLQAPDDESKVLMSRINDAMAGSDLLVALEFCDELIERQPEYAEAWNKRATIHYLLGNNADSVADIRETVSLEPRHFGAISGLGLIFLKEKNLNAALSAFEQVLAISPASENATRSVESLRNELEREI